MTGALVLETCLWPSLWGEQAGALPGLDWPEKAPPAAASPPTASVWEPSGEGTPSVADCYRRAEGCLGTL